MKFTFRILCFLSLAASCLYGQKLEKDKSYYLTAIGFWNVENLYDTINDPLRLDEEFLPDGLNAWTGDRYWTKIDHLSRVISEIATDVTPDGLALLGLCEVENKNVLKDLANSPRLKARNYQIAHIDGPYMRGVDPALLYNPKYFTVKNTWVHKVTLVTDSSYKTRDELIVSGLFNGEPLTVIVNHWPSRRGGEMRSRPDRIAAAKIARRIADSIMKTDPLMKVIIMGDLNDDPTNESVKKHLGTYGNVTLKAQDKFFNPMEPLFKKGVGSLAWQDAWNLFDQIILNKNLVPTDFKTFQFYKAYVYNKPYLCSDFGNFKGYPFRTYSGGTYTAGYSDHFPSYILLVKEKN